MIKQALMEHLKTKGLSIDEFTELLQRLLDNQVIYRAESQVDSKYYDLFIRMEELVKDYLNILNIKLFHETQDGFVAVFPPGSSIPGSAHLDSVESTEKKHLTKSLNINEIALLMVLRFLYEQEIKQGRIDNQSCVKVTIENVNLSFRTLVKKDLPQNIGDRKLVFKTLRKLRIIYYQSEDQLMDTQYWLTIRPLILYFSFDQILEDIEQIQASDMQAGSENEADTEYDQEQDLTSIEHSIEDSILIENVSNKSIFDQ